MMRLSELIGRRVVDGTGRALGRVVEVRSPGRPETEPRDGPRTVGPLLYGRRGLLERLGWTAPDPRQADWREVDIADDGTLRVDAAQAGTKGKSAGKRGRKKRKAHASQSQKAEKGAAGSKERKEC